ncbi:MAG TPA: ABC transporter ATP-binding protein [Chloroflexi bacterium]|nr:ABC transporter ATP-binding protein [Chloroflexota bacterium]HAL26646.1 ABC transporter ATP-binding protein [Chloroflexota bacterium]
MVVSSATLRLEGVFAGYRSEIDVLQDVTLAAPPGAITVIVGPNGAGKSTLLKTVFGFLHPHAGRILLDDRAIGEMSPFQLKLAGVSYIPQGINIFPQLTVHENLLMGGWAIRSERSELNARLDRMYDLFPLLKDRRKRKANELSGGQARMLSAAKEVLTEPKLLLIDEPTTGLSPALSSQVYEFIVSIHESFGATIVLVDQKIEDALEIADEVLLLNLGRVYAKGPRAEFPTQRVRDLTKECLAG